MKKVYIYTDGSCKSNPGPGGWASIIVYKDKELILSGGEANTTNNRMEILSVIKALSALKESCAIVLTSDSKYVIDALKLGWAKGWQKNNWKKADKKMALNTDLWQELLELIDKHQVEYNWVKGHAGHPYNERCDELAQSEAEKFKL